jgi:hypothetical protein
MLHALDRGFRRPDENNFQAWLKQCREERAVITGRFALDEDWAWQLTDSCVAETRTKRTECYPVVFGAFGPLRRATPFLLQDITEGHLLLGFVTEKRDGVHPSSKVGEPRLVVDEAFVLPCWDNQNVEPMLRGCFMY